MKLRIEGHDLPGRTCGAAPGYPGHTGIHVGVQRKDKPAELLDLQPGDADRVAWTLDCRAADGPDGVTLSGPYVQNRLGGRFVYLSWGEVDADGGFHMFRRAKLMLEAVDPAVLSAAVTTGTLLATVRMTDAKGHPVCARLQPPDVTWSAPAWGPPDRSPSAPDSSEDQVHHDRGVV